MNKSEVLRSERSLIAPRPRVIHSGIALDSVTRQSERGRVVQEHRESGEKASAKLVERLFGADVLNTLPSKNRSVMT